MAYTAANDAFCLQADVEGLAGRGAFTSGTTPTAQQVLDWMARIAAEVEAKLFENGITYTVLAHGSPFPGSPTDAKTARLKKLSESANAIGAAGMVLFIHGVKDEYGRSPEAAVLLKQYEGFLESITAVATVVASTAVFSDTNTDKLQFTSGSEF